MSSTTSATTLKDIYEPMQIWLVQFITNHAILWFILLIIIILLLILNFFTKIIPQFDLLKARILLPLSKKFKQRKLVKAAIKSDIEGHVNIQIKNFQKYLPKQWIKQIDIDWVSEEDEKQFIEDERVVLRLRPTDCQDKNFINTTYHFLKQIIFPKTNRIVPEAHLESSVMFLCKKIASRRGGNTMTTFEDDLLEPAIQKYKKMPQFLEDYETIDKKGFFMGTFLRELHLVAMEVRFTPQRSNVGAEANGIIKHIKEFINKYENGKHDIPSSLWYNMTNISKYGLLLVAHPIKAQLSVDAYINRTKEKFDNGANRVYVFGTKSESNFFDAVICGIEKMIPNCELKEKFITPFDYRGNSDGLGALFIKKLQ
jgi:hypothetical protein